MVGEKKVPYHTLGIRPGSGPYVCYDTSSRTSGVETVRLLWCFQEEPHFLNSSSYSPNNSKAYQRASYGLLSRNETSKQHNHAKLSKRYS
jgi:hypothetical protein